MTLKKITLKLFGLTILIELYIEAFLTTCHDLLSYSYNEKEPISAW